MNTAQPKQILHIIHGLTIGGAEVDLLHKCQYLVKQTNCVMTICCLLRRGELAPQFEALGIRVIGPLMRHRYDLGAGLKLRQLLAQPQWDLIHTHLCATNLIVWLVNRTLSRRKPQLAGEHAMAERWPAWVLALDRQMVQTGTKFLVPSQAAADSYRARGVPHAAIQVLVNGVDTERFWPLDDTVNGTAARAQVRQALGIGADEFVIGTICRLAPVKNLPMLFEVAASLPVHVVVVGDGAQRPLLAQMITERGWQARIHLVGSQMNVPDWLAAFDLFVLPSASESFGIVVAEALLAQTPVVATRVGGIPELTGQGAYAILTPAGDGRALQAAIAWTMQNYPQAKVMASQGKIYIEKTFSIAASAATLSKIYAAILAIRRSG